METAGIQWFLFKGADLRNFIYPEPVLRPVSDLDLFVHEADRRRALDTLTAAGYELHANPENASHEATLCHKTIAIDLHWQLFRGGRVDWDELAKTLNWSGTRTAAWSSLYVLRELAAVEAPGGFVQRIQPGQPHRAYLQRWIDRAWITRCFHRRWLVAGLFSLALQDSAKDAWVAWRGQRRALARAPEALLAHSGEKPTSR